MNLREFYILCCNDHMDVKIIYFDCKNKEQIVTSNVSLERIYRDATRYSIGYAENLIKKEISWFRFSDDKITICLKYFVGIEDEL